MSLLKRIIIASFAFVLQRCLQRMASGKAHTPCRAGVYSRRLVGLNLMLRREQAPALRYDPIITQIGRENNISAEICILRVAEDVDPYKHCVKHPYENEPKAMDFFY